MVVVLKNNPFLALCIMFLVSFFHLKATNDTQDVLKNTPLHIAVNNQNEISVASLIALGVNLNATNTFRETPLHLAVKNQSEAIVLFLIKKRADVNAKNYHGLTALHLAVISENERIVRLLLEDDLKTELNLQDAKGQSALHFAARNGNIELVKLLMDYGAKKDITNHLGETSLHWAVRSGNVKLVQLFIAYNAKINTKNNFGETPLHAAAVIGSEALVELLITFGAQVNTQDNRGCTPLHWVAICKEASITIWKAWGHSILIQPSCAEACCKHAVVKLLVKNGAQVNSQDYDGLTPLYLAVIEANESLVQVLIENGAQIDEEDGSQGTLLYCAIKKENVAAVKLFIKYGGKINIKNTYGHTPLHFAATIGSEPIVRLLLENGAKINVQSDCKNTSLHLHLEIMRMGSHYLRRSLVRLLIEHGAEINIENESKQTPFKLLLGEVPQNFIELLLLEIFLYTGEDFDSNFLLEKILEKPRWLVGIESAAKLWSNNEDRNTKLAYLIENYPNLALHILIKNFKENNQAAQQEGITTSFVNAAKLTFSQLKRSLLLEKLRLFYANQLLWQWKRKLSQNLRNILAKKSLDLSLINPKCLEDEVNHLLFLLQVDAFGQSTGAKELQDRMNEQAQIFTQSVCCNLASSLLVNNQQESIQDNIKRIWIDSSQLGSASSLALEFQKLLIKLPKKYSSEHRDAEEKYLLNKLQTVMGFYYYLESIVELQGKLPDVNNDDQNAQAGFFAGKDILSPVHIEQFMNWCNR